MQIIEPRRRELVPGHFVDRFLPVRECRHVGPFVFFDHGGPGPGIDVKPHPHIGLATVTYLFSGKVTHRDSIGSVQDITPGDVNWMTAGSGIAHSERTNSDVHLLQLWCALPKHAEETAPAFNHYAKDTLPTVERDGVTLRILAGDAYGKHSPVVTHSELFYVDATVAKGQTLVLPDYAERAVYDLAKNRLMVDVDQLTAEEDCRVLLLGGQPFPEPRHMWWNFVSTSETRIQQAAQDWRDGKFALVTGDTQERIEAPK